MSSVNMSNYCQKDAVFATVEKDEVTMFLISASGMLFAQPVLDTASDGGPFLLTETVEIPHQHRGKSGSSVFYSPSTNILICSFEDGR